MRNILIILLLLIIAGGAGYWWFTSLPPAQQLNRADTLYTFNNKARKTAGIVFDEANGVALNVWQPEDVTSDSKAPVLIFFYGGSWRSGDKDQYDFFAKSFTSLGYVVVLPNYRLYPKVRWPSMVEDSAAAIAWTHDNIAQYGGDPDNIFLSGHSAGAYNAIMAVIDPQWLARHGKTDAIIRAMAPLAGPYDFYPFDSDSSRDSFGNAPQPEATQPINYARGDLPPALFLTGNTDTVVKPRNSKELNRRIQALGGDAGYKEYIGINHYEIIMATAYLFSGKAPVISDMHGFFKDVLARPQRSAAQPLKAEAITEPPS